MNWNHFDPESAILAARTGDVNAAAKLIGHYRPYLRLLANTSIHRKLRSKVDESDVVQETCLRAANGLDGFRGQTEAEFAAWLRSIFANVLANTRRHFDREKRDLDLEIELRRGLDESSAGFSKLATTEPSPSERASRRERAVILAHALDQLSPQYRTVLQLRDLEGLSIAEIAAELGKSKNAVQKMWARAISEMRQILKDFT